MSKSPATEMVIDNVKVHELSHVKLLKFTMKLYEKCEMEREKRLLAEVDRDKINKFWKISQKQLESHALDIHNLNEKLATSAYNITNLEHQLIMQHLIFVHEDGKTVDRMRKEEHEAIMELIMNHDRQYNEMCKVNKELKDDIKTKDSQQRIRFRHMKVGNIKKIKNNTNFLAKTMARVIHLIEQNRVRTFHKIEERHHVTLDKRRLLHIKDVRDTIDSFRDDVERVNRLYVGKCEEELMIVETLKKKLEKNIQDNLYLNEKNMIVENKNKELIVNIEECELRNEQLERKLLNYKNCQRQTVHLNGQVKHFQTLLKSRNREILMLEHENAEMKEGFEKYDEYFVDMMIDVQRNLYTNKVAEIKEYTIPFSKRKKININNDDNCKIKSEE